MSDSGNEEKRQRIAKDWFKDPLNIILVLVLIFGIGLRFYVYNITANQPVWWDEAAYGTIAKSYTHEGWDNYSIVQSEKSIRPPLFSFIWAIFLFFGFGESAVRFFLEFLPSAFSVWLIYLIGKQLYDKKIGIISALIFSVIWIHLFYTARLLTHIPNILFLLISALYFIKATESEFSPKYFAISLISIIFSALIRYPEGIVLGAYALFILLAQIRLLKYRKFWISGIIGFLPLLIFFAYNLVKHGNIFPALLGSNYVQAVSQKFAFDLLKFIPLYLQKTFFILFLIGLALMLFELAIGYDTIKSSKRLQGHLFLILILIVVYSYFIFSLRGAEDRWLFSTILPLVCIAAFGLSSVYEKISQYGGKNVGLVIISLILIFGAYHQVIYSTAMIKDKIPSFLQEKQGFEWIKSNTPGNSIILGAGADVYSLYYGDRLLESTPQNSSDIIYSNASYFVAHVFAPQPDYINSYLQSTKAWRPIQAFYMDPNQQQPGFIIYEKVNNG